MPALITREEHERRQRRLRRQLIGLAVVFLVLMGAIHLFDIAADAYRKATDPTGTMNEYQNRLRSVVIYDPPVFEDLSAAPNNLVLESSIWGSIYELIDSGEWDKLEKSADERTVLPGVTVSAFAAKLYGPDVLKDHRSFEDDFGLFYEYDPSLQGYLIPVTSIEDNYSPSVVDMQQRGGRRYVTVGYIRNSATGGFGGITASSPQKYVDYVFDRGSGRNWYLAAIEESSRTVDAEDVIQDSVYDLEYDPTAALQEQIDQDDTIQNPNEETQPGTDQPQDEGEGSEAGEGEAAPPDETPTDDSAATDDNAQDQPQE